MCYHQEEEGTEEALWERAWTWQAAPVSTAWLGPVLRPRPLCLAGRPCAAGRCLLQLCWGVAAACAAAQSRAGSHPICAPGVGAVQQMLPVCTSCLIILI